MNGFHAYTHLAADGGFVLADDPAGQAWIARMERQEDHVGIDA